MTWCSSMFNFNRLISCLFMTPFKVDFIQSISHRVHCSSRKAQVIQKLIQETLPKIRRHSRNLSVQLPRVHGRLDVRQIAFLCWCAVKQSVNQSINQYRCASQLSMILKRLIFVGDSKNSRCVVHSKNCIVFLARCYGDYTLASYSARHLSSCAS